jgi:hypothetical protein
VAVKENGLWSRFFLRQPLLERSLTRRSNSVLNAELSHMEFRQLHSAAPTLIATLRRSFAQKTNGHIGNTATKMWEVLSSSVFDEVDEDKMVKIVRGEALVGGMKRMGY